LYDTETEEVAGERWQAWASLEFKAFVNAFMRIPVQLVRTSRRLVFRLLAWNPWQAVFLRGVDQLRTPLQC
jgi:hypothetical protein